MKRLFPFFVSVLLLLTGCSNPLALINSATTEINFELNASSCKDEQWVVPGMPQIFIIMARQSTPPFDIQDQDRIYFSISVPPGRTETTFTAPAMPAEYQVICGPADDLEPIGRNRLVVVQSREN
jgi:hypothetical protein